MKEECSNCKFSFRTVKDHYQTIYCGFDKNFILPVIEEFNCNRFLEMNLKGVAKRIIERYFSELEVDHSINKSYRISEYNKSRGFVND